MILLTVFLTLAFSGIIFRRWRRGVVMLLVYIPFAGAVTLLLQPSPLPIFFKDIFFVIPAYLAFFMSPKNELAQGHVPNSVILTMLVLTTVVIAQSFNPDVANWLVSIIGAKIWLFYLPLLFLAFVMPKSKEDLIRLLRLMSAIAWIPCSLGIMQWLTSINYGYQETMTAFYGDAAAEGATQGFTSFDVGGTFYRIPSTFTFVAQYFGYTLAMIVPSYALMKMDPSKKWRSFATATLCLVIVASFMSGSRAAYLFVPLLLVLIYLLEGKFIGMIKITVVLPLALLLTMSIARIDPIMMSDMMLDLFVNYSNDIAKESLMEALNEAPLGMGTGMNTGAARYAFDDPNNFAAFENYYAKAAYELGVMGLIIVMVLFIILIRQGHRIHSRIQDAGLKSCSTSILAFIVTMALNSFKGWQIDIDPINVYFWIFSGFLLKLGYLDTLSQASIQSCQTGATLCQEFSAERPHRT